MAWFYYSGQTVTPIDIGNGNSVGVRPHTHVEVPDSAASNGSIQRLMGMGVLRQTGMPEHARKAERGAKAKADLAEAKAKSQAPKPSPITKADLEEVLNQRAGEAEAKTELESPEPNEVQEKPKRKRRRRRSGEESGGSSDK
jgi:hypothetical protein